MNVEQRIGEIKERHKARLEISDEDIDILLKTIHELQEENLTLWCQNNGLTKALRIAKI